MIIPISIKIILYMNITSTHKSLKKLLQIPKGRLSQSCLPLQVLKVGKEDPKCFSLTVVSFRVSYFWLSFFLLFSLSLMPLFNIFGCRLSDTSQASLKKIKTNFNSANLLKRAWASMGKSLASLLQRESYHFSIIRGCNYHFSLFLT